MAKYNYYAVARGIDPITKQTVTNILFKTWDEAKLYVVGIQEAKYKGFLTEEEANTWMAQKTAEIASPIGLHVAKSNKVDEDFTSICSTLCIAEEKMIQHLKQTFVNEYNFMNNRVRQQ